MIKNNYLYILPFKNENLFKVGISSNNLKRIIHHTKTFNIDVDNSYIYMGEHDQVRALEKMILCTFRNDCKHAYQGKDGYTEIRDKKRLSKCFEIIEFNRKVLELKKERLSDEYLKKAKETFTKNNKATRYTNQKDRNWNKLLNLTYEFDIVSEYVKKALPVTLFGTQYIRLFLDEKELIDFGALSFCIELTKDKSKTWRRIGAESAVVSRESNDINKIFCQYIDVHFPLLSDYEYNQYNEYSPEFEERYNILRSTLLQLI